MKRLLLTLAILGTSQVYAYDDSYYFDEPIDVDGLYLEAQPGQNPSDQIKKMRAQLEKRNEMMVRQRIEKARVQQELEMMKKLNQAMNKSFQQIDSALNNM